MVSFGKSLVGLLALGAAVTVAFGGVAVSAGPITAGILVLLFAGLAYGVVQGDEFSVTFGLTVGAVIIGIYQLMPPGILERLPLGTTLGGLDGLTVIVTVTVVVLVWWVIDVRFLSTKAKKPGTVAKRVRKRFVKLVEAYATVTRVAFVAGVMAGAAILSQLGAGMGELGSVIAEAPFAVGNLLTAGLGYVSAGGSLPVVGSYDISAALFALLAIAIIVAAAATEYND